MQLTRLGPGVLLAAAVAAVAWGLQALETRWLAQPILESLVLAILLGMAVRNVVFRAQLDARYKPGLDLCAKQVLEVAVLLLGGTMNLRELLAGGPRLLLGVALAVTLTLVVSTQLSRRLFGLPKNPSTLIAVGNAICGNSAIAAVAPLIGASAAEVAGAVAFTAVLGVALVLALPLFILPLLHFSHTQYGTLVGMTVYAVPQVLAASFPVSDVAGQTATLVKLTRVLFLGPLALWFSLTRRASSAGGGKRPTVGQLVPWFIAGFIAMAALRTAGVIPQQVATWLKEISRLLTVLAMAALGLGVDVRALRAAGARTTGAVCLSLLFLLGLSIALIKLLALG
jgi:uncharacterized integral membrane protein (TIGR00698 family)